MNIVVLARYAGNPHPATSFIHDQVKAMQSLGHNIFIIVPKAFGKDRSRNPSSLEVQVIDELSYIVPSFLSLSNWGEYSFNNYTFDRAVVKALKRLSSIGFQPNIIHAHTFSAPSFSAIKQAKNLGIPSVITTHGGDLRVALESGKASLIKHRIDSSDRVIAVSEKLRHMLKELSPNADVEVIYNGFQPVEVQVEKKPQLITSCGNLRVSKRFDLTIQSFANILPEFPGARLQIIGRGPCEARLRDLVQELGIEEQVQFLGQLPNHEVQEQMARSEVFVLPSVNEGFGIVYLEAMSQKCIVIATKDEGFSEIVSDGTHCLLVEPDSVEDLSKLLYQALSSPEKMEEIAQAGYELAKQYTWHKNAQSTIELYQSLLK